jgi:Methyltransferase domain.
VASSYGYVATSDFLSISNSLIFKTGQPKESAPEFADLSILYEYFVGIACTNELRKSIGNFMYVFSLFQCNTLSLAKEDFCSSTNDLQYYTIFEKINGEDLFSFIIDIKDTETDYRRLVSYIIQILMALQVAQDKFSFTHNDLHLGNIILRPSLKGAEDVRYELDGITYQIKTDVIPTFIDYGHSHFLYHGVPMGIMFDIQGVDNINTNTGIDMYKLLMYILHHCFDRKPRLFKRLSWILDYYLDKEDVDGLIEAHKKDDDTLINKAMMKMEKTYFTFGKQHIRLAQTSPRDFLSWMKSHQPQLWNHTVTEFKKVVPQDSISQIYQSKIDLYGILKQPVENIAPVSCAPKNYHSLVINQYMIRTYQHLQQEFHMQFSPMFSSLLHLLEQETRDNQNKYQRNDVEYEEDVQSQLAELQERIQGDTEHRRGEISQYISLYENYKTFLDYSNRYTTNDTFYYTLKRIQEHNERLTASDMFSKLEQALDEPTSESETLNVISKIKQQFPIISGAIRQFETAIFNDTLKRASKTKKTIYIPPHSERQISMVIDSPELVDLLRRYTTIYDAKVIRQILQAHKDKIDKEILSAFKQYKRDSMIPYDYISDLQPVFSSIPKVGKYLDFGGSDGKVGKSIAQHLHLPPDRSVCCDIKPCLHSVVPVNSSGPLPFEDGTFSLITCFQVLHHVSQLKDKIQELYRVMTENGLIVIQENDISQDPKDKLIGDIEHTMTSVIYNRQQESPPVFQSKKRWVELFEENGFKFVPISYKENETPTKTFYSTFQKKPSSPPRKSSPRTSEWKITKTRDLNEATLAQIYNMYARSYSEANLDLWLDSPQELANYSDSIMYLERNKKIISVLMYKLLSNTNKISLVAHDSTREGKDKMIEKIVQLMSTSGWIIEASGALSWILRSKYNLSPITDKNVIYSLLHISDKQRQKIQMNPDYNEQDKTKQVYTHIYYSRDGKLQHQNAESLFGNVCRSCSE